MRDQEIEEIQNLEDWEEVTHKVRVAPSRQRRAVVSVAFSRPDFTQVVEFAERHGLKTSELIRKAVLAYIGSDPAGSITSVSGSPDFVNSYLTASAGVSSARSEVREPDESSYSTR